MLVVLGDVYVQIPKREEAGQLMLAIQRAAREEEGCISYTFAETLDDPGHLVLVQQWRDQQALDAHYRSQAFIDYQASISESLVRSSELRVLSAQDAYTPFESPSIEPQSTD
jgi:quinol monooxygenase YgiN